MKKSVLMRNKYFRRFCEDADFNFRVTLYTGLFINVIYAVFKLVSGLYYHSEWFIAIAVYYSFLILLKCTLVRHDIRFLRKGKAVDEVAGWKAYRRVGWLMLLLNVGLSGIVAQVAARNSSYFYPGVVIFAVAAYSFYRIVIAIIRLAKERGNGDPILSAARAIDFSFALTAMFTLQTAMFASFAKGFDGRRPNIITGTAVALIITLMAVVMIIRASLRLKTLQ